MSSQPEPIFFISPPFFLVTLKAPVNQSMKKLIRCSIKRAVFAASYCYI